MRDFGLSPEARIIPLRGFSGCSVILVEDTSGIYVRKLARDVVYNRRLLQQAEKQTAFFGNSCFQAVKVRASGHLTSGIAYIDMEYVPGVTAAEALEVLPLVDIPRWSAMLLGFSEVSDREKIALSPTLFYDKINDLQRDLTTQGLVTAAVAQTLDLLRRRPWIDIPKSPCHGDLTLENIIVYDGKPYLIDFLDSFADSWYLDIAKLLQDILGGWSFRHKEINRNLTLRLASLRHSLETALEARYPGCLAPIHDLYALGLLRILPYASSPEDRAFVDSRLTMALNNFL